MASRRTTLEEQYDLFLECRKSGLSDRDFSPYPKNPKIAKLFKEIGWVDELGSGVRNIYKYNMIYSGANPEFIEGDVFKTIIPLIPLDTAQDTAQDEDIIKLLEFCKIPRTRNEIQVFMQMKHREHFRKNILNPLIENGRLKMTFPEKPTSKNQKYYS